jgi:hypothetical protein
MHLFDLIELIYDHRRSKNGKKQGEFCSRGMA